jgi:hypothetical protein
MVNKIPFIDYSNHPAYGKLFGKPSLHNQYFALRIFLPIFIRCLKNNLDNLKYNSLTIDSSNRNNSTELRQFIQDGIIVKRISSMTKLRLINLLNPKIFELKCKRANIPLSERTFIDNMLYLQGDILYNECVKLLHHHEIIKMASIYVGYPIDLQKISLHIYDENDNFIYQNFKSMVAPTTTDMHIDWSQHRMVKCLIYLNDVDQNNGPFKYVMGSNNFKVGLWEKTIRYANSFCGLNKCSSLERELFWALPKLFQKKADFGNDLLDTSLESVALQERERHFTSQDGDILFFDNEGIHRGGDVQKGERQVLQLYLWH